MLMSPPPEETLRVRHVCTISRSRYIEHVYRQIATESLRLALRQPSTIALVIQMTVHLRLLQSASETSLSRSLQHLGLGR